MTNSTDRAHAANSRINTLKTYHMAGAKEIKRKITSIKNTGKITKAMELISTVKMKKAQDAALSKKDYVLEVLKMFLRIEDSLAEYPLFRDGLGNKTL